MSTFRIAVILVFTTLLSGCRSAGTNLVVRVESPLPVKVFGETLNARVDFTQLDGRSLIVTTIRPDGR